MVNNYLVAIVQDRHLAEDLTQETFLAAHKSLDRFTSGGNFGAWLRGIARNKARDHWRVEGRRQLVVDSRIVEGMDEVYTLFDEPDRSNGAWQDRLEVMLDCIRKLSTPLQEAVYCVYREGRSLKEASEKLNIGFDAAAQRLSRARSFIRQCVGRHMMLPEDRS